MHNGLTVVAFQLVDHPAEAGGLGLVPGTHKSNVASPPSLRNHTAYQEFVKQVTCKAGDVVIFSEATVSAAAPQATPPTPRVVCWPRHTDSALTLCPVPQTHGTLPWQADYQRRSVLFRYSPANLAYAGGRHEFDRDVRASAAWPASWYRGLTPEQRAVLEPPYHARLDRPVLGDDGELTKASRRLLADKGWEGIGANSRTIERKQYPKL